MPQAHGESRGPVLAAGWRLRPGADRCANVGRVESPVTIVEVRHLADPLLADVRRLLEGSFPPDERPEFDGARLGRAGFHLLAILSGGRFAGFHTHWDLGDFVFCEHFAIAPDMRSHGLGGRVIEAILRRFEGRTLVGEVERPETEEARRRIAFWERCGWQVNPWPYLQPPYAPGKSAVPMLLISHPGPLDETRFAGARDAIHRRVYETPAAPGIAG
jgi:GNAT superfamily N-acetyltransferase